MHCCHQEHSALPLPLRLLCTQEILDVEQVTEESQGMELNDENVDQVRRTSGNSSGSGSKLWYRAASSSVGSGTRDQHCSQWRQAEGLSWGAAAPRYHA